MRRTVLAGGELSGNALRVKMYGADGTVVYSNDASLIGTTTDHMAEIRAVLSGRPHKGVSTLNHEGGSGKNLKVLESYAPVYLASSSGNERRAVGVFEIYSDYTRVAAATRNTITPIALILGVAMLALYLALFPILLRTSNTLKASDRQAMRQAELLSAAQEETIMRLSLAAEQRDAETGEHILRMGRYCTLMAEKVGMCRERVELIRLASPLHDVGKIAIPDAVLQKPGRLTPAERSEMEKHAQIGHDMLCGSDNELLELAATIALTHHEHWDGNGYPNGLIGKEIPIEGRIAAIADVFDALTSDRVYRPAMSLEQALEIMSEGRGTQFDPHLLDLFLANLSAVLVIRAQTKPRAKATNTPPGSGSDELRAAS
jgi:HD-GYP domain-containing protein (c-di-GMP phosphodiesterase class II)